VALYEIIHIDGKNFTAYQISSKEVQGTGAIN
jgi:hypothetical protein